jgi:hypothetical protein
MTRSEYLKALDAFDWNFEHADEHARWARGFNALARLRKAQKEHDPDGAMWLSTPGSDAHGAPRPCLKPAA